ncbi:SusC/RagA family TonB-linked outer membrane protein [Foetidibacter luteolus]|uniref:SusC/RagA family TonB-linked outer membrane protein n=1 Tax=Foetidibacter luteolus TaxID=2608880 RepID=UPI001A97DB14|nr:TonB-dependent receptor [Foetidibacter luteolus]
MSSRITRIVSCCLLFLLPVAVFAQQKVTGKVTNAKDGKPIPFATVMVKGTTVATNTDEEGVFSLNVPAGNTVLTVSSVGFVPLDVTIANGVANASLIETTSDLNEIVVTGYSSQRKKDITGSVSVVKVADLQAIPATTAENQLQGRAAGVNVTTNSQPGSVSTVRIRGFASFTGNDPLYIVDGVPVGSLLGINPDDIESMQILKDAASASVYGARASNGVIIITTKKGKTGAAKVTYNMYYGVQNPGAGWGKGKMLNPQEYADLEWLAYKNSGRAPSSPQYGSGATPVLPDYLLAGTAAGLSEGDPRVSPDLYDLNYSRLGDANYAPYLIVRANKTGTNWWDEVTRVAPIMNHTLTVSGGSADKSKYLASFNYFNQDGIVINNFYRRYSARFNTEFNVKKNIRIGSNMQVFFSEANAVENNTENSDVVLSRLMLPIVPVYTIVPGDFAGTRGGGLGTPNNMVAFRERRKNNRANGFLLFGNAYAEVDLLKHFTARTSFGGYFSSFDTKNYPYIEYEGSENDRNPTYSSTFGKNRSWVWTNQLSYKNTFGEHFVQALAGTEAVEEFANQVTGSRSNYFTYFNYDYITLSSGTSNQLASGSPSTASLFSLFGKVDYTFKDRYLLSLTVRRDGSSRFGSDARYGTFPAGSLGWRISEESFLKDVSWIKELKIRGSWGRMGNQRIGPTNQFTQFSPSNSAASYDINGSSTTPSAGFYNNFIGNSAGQWETNVTTNIGFDAFLFKGTEIVFDWYHKKTEDLLYPVQQLATSGGIAALNPPFFNVGSMKNWGIDIQISQKANLGDVKFDGTVTFTTYKNTITSISQGLTYFDYNSPLNEANRINGTFTRNAVGEAINAYYGYQIVGMFQSSRDVEESPVQDAAAPGRFKYLDADGNDTINASDRVFFGNPNPKFTYGLNLEFSYKGFDLAAFFYGVQGRDAINYGRFNTDFYQTGVTNKARATLYDSWTPERPNATFPIQEVDATFSTNTVPNSFYMENASYLRLRNLTLGYTIPSRALSRLKIDKFRVYVQATNLFTITKYTGLDPEIVTTDDRAAGIDLGVYPTVKTFLIGASINF